MSHPALPSRRRFLTGRLVPLPVPAAVATIGVSCLSHRGIDCQICRDGCPQDAIRFPPRPGGPFRPLVRADACTGCGVCVEACPVSAIGLDRTGADADA